MKVYQCINAVQADLAKIGVGKDEKNTVQNYKFRGIDTIYNALAPLLAKHGLCILPKVLKREVTERATARGGILFYIVVEVEFSFVCAEDGSSHIVCTYGEAMDSGDKATNKAMSAAYKYAAIQAFCIPTEGDNDGDASTYEAFPRAPEFKPKAGIKVRAAGTSLSIYDIEPPTKSPSKEKTLERLKELLTSRGMFEEPTKMFDFLSKLKVAGLNELSEQAALGVIKKIEEKYPELAQDEQVV